MLYYPILCYAMLCYAILCYAMLSYTMLCFTLRQDTLRYVMLCYAVPALKILFCNVTLRYVELSQVRFCYVTLRYAMLGYPILCYAMLYLTNRFHFAVLLYPDNVQMTSKHGKNKEVRYEPQAYHVLTSSVRYQSRDPRQNEIYLFYTITRTFDQISRASITLTEPSQKLSNKVVILQSIE